MLARKYSLATALVVGAVVFVGMFLALEPATDLIRLVGPTVLAAVAATGTNLLLARSPAQIADETYAQDARALGRGCTELAEQIRRDGRQLRSASMRRELDRMVQVVPELLARVERTSPSSLYSSASQLKGHLTSLQGVVRTYSDIEKHPNFYDQPDQLLLAGEQAVRRFVEFGHESIRLVNQGDLASYQANLATVAPPEMPELTRSPSLDPHDPKDH
ncbi:hypothetical protein ACTQ49_01690 [Luteococcus sp. Sow4_B9]|uniref:hypothetical protein n=1 Tax=Luteococcus sp. Sow4_B9 TaxID=3438792 RepID=UPI003F9B9802